MIDPKWMLAVQSMLRTMLKREPSGDEVNNALKDPAIAAQLLFALHDQNAANIAAITTKVGVAPVQTQPVVQ